MNSWIWIWMVIFNILISRVPKCVVILKIMITEDFQANGYTRSIEVWYTARNSKSAFGRRWLSEEKYAVGSGWGRYKARAMAR